MFKIYFHESKSFEELRLDSSVTCFVIKNNEKIVLVTLDKVIDFEISKVFLELKKYFDRGLEKCQFKAIGNKENIILLDKALKKFSNNMLSSTERSESYVVRIFFKENRVQISNETKILEAAPSSVKKNIKVIVVDDSRTVQLLICKMLSKDLFIEVIDVISDPTRVEASIQKLRPDVITLDMNMPVMDGVALLKQIGPKYKIPTIVVSALSLEQGSLVLQALEQGAVDYFQKPNADNLENESLVLCEKIRTAASSKVIVNNLSSQPVLKNKGTFVVDKIPKLTNEQTNKDFIVAIGASTGGTEAIRMVLEGLPKDFPPVVIVQHIPPIFSAAFAARLNTLCQLEVKEAEDGDIVAAGRVLIAPGHAHMVVERHDNGAFYVRLLKTEKVSGHMPSVDMLFQSIVKLKHKKVLALLLTGMGKDGAQGLKALRDQQARTIAQSEGSCVVFGMPKEGIRLGGAEFVEDLLKMPAKMINLLK